MSVKQKQLRKGTVTNKICKSFTRQFFGRWLVRGTVLHLASRKREIRRRNTKCATKCKTVGGVKNGPLQAGQRKARFRRRVVAVFSGTRLLGGRLSQLIEKAWACLRRRVAPPYSSKTSSRLTAILLIEWFFIVWVVCFLLYFCVALRFRGIFLFYPGSGRTGNF